MEQAHADPRVVQQLMSNRILTFMRSLSVDGVTVTSFDAEAGTSACCLAGVNFVVSIRLSETEPATG